MRWIRALGATALLVGAAPSLAATISVDVKVVRASATGETDSRLKALKSQLRSRGYRGFELRKEQSVSLRTAKETTVQINKRYALELTLLRRNDKAARIHIEALRDGRKLASADVTIPKDQAYLLVLKQDGPKALVIPITPRF